MVSCLGGDSFVVAVEDSSMEYTVLVQFVGRIFVNLFPRLAEGLIRPGCDYSGVSVGAHRVSSIQHSPSVKQERALNTPMSRLSGVAAKELASVSH